MLKPSLNKGSIKRMDSRDCVIIGAPIQVGASQPGCVMGPDALRTAGLVKELMALGHQVEDFGNLKIESDIDIFGQKDFNQRVEEVSDWTRELMRCATETVDDQRFPIFLGGDHSMACGTVTGVAKSAQKQGKEQFVLWLDAHPDIHDLDSSQSGNLHGTPVAYFSGLSDFGDAYPYPTYIPAQNICMIGIRSVDPAERTHLAHSKIKVHDMRALDEHGIVKPLGRFLEKVREAKGNLHVSLDVDFLDPAIAPAVGTTVPGGATFREAHLVMEMLCDSKLVTSFEMVELNPFLDERGRTAKLLVDLCASLMGRRVLDRMTRSY